MTRFPTRVWATIRRYGLMGPGDRVLVAVSGGVDSVSLLHVLTRLAPRAGATLTGIVHVHHGLRGEDADADAQFCQALAASHGLPIDVVAVDVAAEAARRRWSVERTAHVLRHAALREVAGRVGATRIALGHTLDDQAETVVLRFLRGAGTRGLAGMWPVKGLVIRPLIEVRRADVEQYAAERGLTWKEDASNRDPGIPRNLVRHTVLPALMQVAGRSLPERLARQADAWRDDDRWLTASVATLLPSVLREGAAPSQVVVDLVALAAVPESLGRRVRMAVLERVLPPGQVSLSLVESLARAERMPDGRRARLAGVEARREGSRLHLARVVRRDSEPGATARPAWPEQTLQVPGRLDIPEAHLTVEAVVVPREEWQGTDRAGRDGRHVCSLDAERAGRVLGVRTRRPGDRMRPRGAPGSQKIQDLMVNRKVPRADRARVPVITSADGQIAWLVGLAVGEDFAVQPQTTAVLLLKVSRSGGQG